MDKIQQLTFDFNEPSPKLCECGCGQATRIAPDSCYRLGRVRGQAYRFIRGHNSRLQQVQERRPLPKPSSTTLCHCGCGLTTPIAKKTSNRRGTIKGQHTRFIQRHSIQIPFRTDEQRFWSKVDCTPTEKGCWPWLSGTSPKGYGTFWKDEHSHRAHRISYELCVGPIPDGMNVLHRCDNPSCVNPAHLFLGTDADNVRDMVEKGRRRTPGARNPARGDRNGARLHPERLARGDASGARKHPEAMPRGSRHGNTKFTEQDVIEIRRLASEGVPQSQIARQFQVSQGCIWLIIKRRNWVHI